MVEMSNCVYVHVCSPFLHQDYRIFVRDLTALLPYLVIFLKANKETLHSFDSSNVSPIKSLFVSVADVFHCWFSSQVKHYITVMYSSLYCALHHSDVIINAMSVCVTSVWHNLPSSISVESSSQARYGWSHALRDLHSTLQWLPSRHPQLKRGLDGTRKGVILNDPQTCS